jgi:hypothetical protein
MRCKNNSLITRSYWVEVSGEGVVTLRKTSNIPNVFSPIHKSLWIEADLI